MQNLTIALLFATCLVALAPLSQAGSAYTMPQQAVSVSTI